MDPRPFERAPIQGVVVEPSAHDDIRRMLSQDDVPDFALFSDWATIVYMLSTHLLDDLKRLSIAIRDSQGAPYYRLIPSQSSIITVQWKPRRRRIHVTHVEEVQR